MSYSCLHSGRCLAPCLLQYFYVRLRYGAKLIVGIASEVFKSALEQKEMKNIVLRNANYEDEECRLLGCYAVWLL
jgi:hypothetical protein